MSDLSKNSWLHRFAVLTAICTLGLIGLGGLVTSHGVGMAVPDWPTTYGYNMFLFPISQWIGGVFYEHTHRLVASAVGLLTAILALWLWIHETTGKTRRNGIISICGVLFVAGGMMGVRTTPVFVGIALACVVGIGFGIFKVRQTEGLRWFGVVALFAVLLQGVLGGLRVTEMKDEIGIFHATLAQLFLVLISAIALFSSSGWKQISNPKPVFANRNLLRFAAAISFLILFQLILGAAMRHQHAGLAIPDFPLAYGKIWPPTDAASLQAINHARHDVRDYNPITAAHIIIHMAHRITAFAILAGVGILAMKFRRSPLSRIAMVWLMMILAQLGLGIVTVLMNKPADIATAHVVLGAASLVMGALITLVCRKISVEGAKRIRHLPDPVEPASNSKAALTI